MDDLISRAAVVRALASSNGDYLDALERIEKIPAVDAILIDWLDAQIRGYASALKSTELGALLVVKRLWEKVQEAR